MSGLDQVLNILRAVGQTSDTRATTIAGKAAERLGSVLEPMLAERGELSSRAILLEAVRKTFGWLANANPRNATWQSGLCASLGKIGDVLIAQGNLAEALSSFRQSRDIAERLAKADPGSAGWQYSLGISNDRIGDVFVAQSKLEDALKVYQNRHNLISRLAKANPGNAGLERW